MPDQPSKESLERAPWDVANWVATAGMEHFGFKLAKLIITKRDNEDDEELMAWAVGDSAEQTGRIAERIVQAINSEEELRQQNAALVSALRDVRATLVRHYSGNLDWRRTASCPNFEHIDEVCEQALAPYAPADAPEKEP